jgi:fructose-1,6-bisphosphatase
MLYAKFGGVLAVVLTIYFGYIYITNLQEDNVRLEKNVTTLKISVESVQRLNEKINREVEESKLNLANLYKKFNKAQEDKQKLVKMFANHDFAKLLQKKPGLITKRMIKATKKRLAEVQDEINK